MKNGSGIRPMAYNVLVAPKEVETTTAGGLIVPDETREKEQFARMEGELVAVSPMAFTFEGDWPDDVEKPKPGARVLFSRYSGIEVKGRDAGSYWLLKDRDIIGVMENV